MDNLQRALSSFIFFVTLTLYIGNNSNNLGRNSKGEGGVEKGVMGVGENNWGGGGGGGRGATQRWTFCEQFVQSYSSCIWCIEV